MKIRIHPNSLDAVLCGQCCGSGEGPYEGTCCSACGGSGEVASEQSIADNEAARADYENDQARERRFDTVWELEMDARR